MCNITEILFRKQGWSLVFKATTRDATPSGSHIPDSMLSILLMQVGSLREHFRHCEEYNDEAIHLPSPLGEGSGVRCWIASLRSQWRCKQGKPGKGWKPVSPTSTLSTISPVSNSPP